MKTTYTIYQLPVEHPNTFMNHSWAERHGGVNRDEYEVVYTAEIEAGTPERMLDKLYTVFNTAHPADYRGRSLSVSDLIALDGIGVFFCDSFGWQKV